MLQRGTPRRLQPLSVYTMLTLLIHKPITDRHADPLSDFSLQHYGLRSVTIAKVSAATLCNQQGVAASWVYLGH